MAATLQAGTMKLGSLKETILRALQPLQNGDANFTPEMVVVLAWRGDKEKFGLKGFEQIHPDSNKILSNIWGRKGLLGRGYLELSGVRRLKLTDKGKQFGREQK